VILRPPDDEVRRPAAAPPGRSDSRAYTNVQPFGILQPDEIDRPIRFWLYSV